MVGDEEHAAEAFEREALEACLELPWGGGDGESFTSFASWLDSVGRIHIVIVMMIIIIIVVLCAHFEVGIFDL